MQDRSTCHVRHVGAGCIPPLATPWQTWLRVHPRSSSVQSQVGHSQQSLMLSDFVVLQLVSNVQSRLPALKIRVRIGAMVVRTECVASVGTSDCVGAMCLVYSCVSECQGFSQSRCVFLYASWGVVIPTTRLQRLTGDSRGFRRGCEDGRRDESGCPDDWY